MPAHHVSATRSSIAASTDREVYWFDEATVEPGRDGTLLVLRLAVSTEWRSSGACLGVVVRQNLIEVQECSGNTASTRDCR